MIDESINNKIDLMVTEILKTIVPQDYREDFEDGIVSIADGFASFDMVDYFNGLQKLKLFNYGITAALFSNPERKEVALQASPSEASGINFDILDSDEFAEQGFNKPVMEQAFQYEYYVVQQGDTMRSLANRFYGNFEYWPKIAKANNLSENDFIDGDLVGHIIKIPITGDVAVLLGNNLVFEGRYDSSDVESIQKYLYGSDIFLYAGKMMVSSLGDITTVRGMECIIANILDRILMPQGGLNDLHPIVGVSLPTQSASEPFFVGVEKMLTNVEQQTLSDPRVVSAAIIRKDLQLLGDQLIIKMDVELIGGFSTQVEVMK